MKYVSISLRSVLTVYFSFTILGVFLKLGVVQELFENMQEGQRAWLLYVGVMAQILGVILLWSKRFVALGGMILGMTMVGAIYIYLNYIGILDETVLYFCCFGILSTILMWMHFSQLGRISNVDDAWGK